MIDDDIKQEIARIDKSAKYSNPLDYLNLEGVEVKEFMTQVKVKAIDFLAVMQDLAAILADKDASPIVAVKLTDALYFRVSTPAVDYEGRVPVYEVPEVDDIDLAFVFTDSTKILPDNGDLEITLAGTCIIIEDNEGFKQAIPTNTSYIKQMPEVLGTKEIIQTRKLKDSLAIIKNTSILERTYKKDALMRIHDGNLIIQYGTMWIESECPNLNLVLTRKTAKILSQIISRDTSMAVVSNSGYTVFQVKHGNLFIASKDEVKLTTIDEYSKGFTYAGEFNFEGYQQKVKALQDSFKSTDVKVNLFDSKGIKLNIDAEYNKINRPIGDCSGRIILSFTMRLEFLTVMLGFIKSYTTIYAKGDYVCLKGPGVKLLMCCSV